MAENIQGLLLNSANALGVRLMPAQTDAFQTYLELLLEWNKKMNLTAITDPREVCIKHFVDSLTVLDAVEPKTNAKVLDVGSGAGFPGIPLKIAREDIQLTIIDSLQKRLTFLQEVLDKTHLSAELLHGRAEDFGREKNLRVKFDVVTARAVAPLNLLCEYCMPFVKTGGIFMAMKGKNEIAESASAAVKLLVGKIEQDISYTVNDESRKIFIIKKISQTPTKYPRNSGQIKSKPL